MGRWLLLVCMISLTAGLAIEPGPAASVQEEVEAWFASLPALWPTGTTSVADGRVLYRLSGEGGGVWRARLSRGRLRVRTGEIDSPTVTIECAAETWLAIVHGELDLSAAHTTGQLRMTGDSDWAVQLHSHLRPLRSEEMRVTTDTRGWYQFQPLPNDFALAVASDASGLLEPPAGRHGFVTVQGDQFVFADGTPVRFWGTNIVAGDVFMDHETARRTAARLARFGCNMVRLHHMDADWARPNIFDQAYDDTQHLSAESLDRLDYLIYQLKRHGIYVYLDLLVHRKFKAGDGVRDWQQVENGAKVVAHFNPRIIELQRQYAHDLYTHVNTYTGLRYCDDPVIAMSEIINESTLFWDGGYRALPASYMEEIDGLYAEWARSRGERPAADSVLEGLNAEAPQTLAFLYQTQVAYFTGMRDYLRAIGVKVPIAGSNHWESMEPDIRSNLALDYLDRHGYWDHPQGGYGPDARFANRPMVKSEEWNLATALIPRRALDKPVIVTEWNCSWINDYIAEGPLTMAAHGAAQGWDGLLQFDYAGDDWADMIEGNFDIGNKPHVFATWPAAARLFRLGEMRPEGVNWDASAGLLTADAPANAARIGFASGAVRVGSVSFELTPEFAVAAVSALDGQPIDRSEHLLITATARAENTGMVFAVGRTSALEAGRAPILMQPVRGRVRVTMEGPITSVAAWALDPAGRRQGQVRVTREGNAISLPLEADGFWYEVTVGR